MTTFGNWLTEQSDRDDEVGQAAKIFVEGGKTGKRGKINSPAGVQRWFDAMDEAEPDAPPRYGPLCAKAGREYRERRGDLRVAAQDPAGGLEAKLDIVIQLLLSLGAQLPEVWRELQLPAPAAARAGGELLAQGQAAEAAAAVEGAVRSITGLSPQDALAATRNDLMSRSSIGSQVSAAMQGLAGELVQEAVNDRPLRHADFGYLYRVADFTEGEASGG